MSGLVVWLPPRSGCAEVDAGVDHGDVTDARAGRDVPGLVGVDVGVGRAG